MHPFVLVAVDQDQEFGQGKKVSISICGVAKASDPYPWFAALLWPGSNCLARHAVRTAGAISHRVAEACSDRPLTGRSASRYRNGRMPDQLGDTSR